MTSLDIFALARQYASHVQEGHLALINLARSIRTDDTLSDDEIAARALAVVWAKGPAIKEMP